MAKLRPVALLLSLVAACGGGADAGDDGVDPAVDGGADPDARRGDAGPQVNFSFFVTSLDTMRTQSGSQDGFGGDLGGLDGADAICQTAADNVGFGYKTWRAFLSVYNNGSPIHAIDRIGDGPWYDRNGRLIAQDHAGLLTGNRPAGDTQAVNDLPDENGTPLTTLGDTHDILTASNEDGEFDGSSANASCQDWTSAAAGPTGAVRCGHSWPAMSGQHWIRAHTVRGCEPGVNLVQNGPGEGSSVGAGGGWGGIYCFALEP